MNSSELDIQNRLRMEASKRGGILFRNNVGAALTKDGSYIRFGLANDSKAINKRFKSSDLIGLFPILIGPEHVGSTIGQFTAIEVKPEGWVYRGTEREIAQLNFLEAVKSKGGKAIFCSGKENI